MGRSIVVTVSGDQGVGKTRLAAALVRLLNEGAQSPTEIAMLRSLWLNERIEVFVNERTGGEPLNPTKPELRVVVETALRSQEARLERVIDERFASYRKSYVRGEKWCCVEMTSFATKHWNLPSPSKVFNEPSEVFSAVSLQLRGHNIVFCPFCGVKL